MTKYSDIFLEFKDKITDPDLLTYVQDIQTDILISLLKKACTRFKRVCVNDLMNRDDTLQQFNIDLDDEEISIISEIMVEYWLEPSLNNIENLRNNLSTKDFSFFSPANLLNAVKDVYSNSHKRSISEINQYSFIHGDFGKLRK